ncbi:hydroxyphenylacetyl-CoA thioesterase PaaI [Thalassobaculum sp. OXR-137]|uniref:hydroxyphenylacetyl-CoA thioesterase PaaI n=1 Tax=Thalassobaculum sp. OXR-137 TaxID=3100173 RepID=UPI002AC93E45|nr:hydroxyphenylacetyl-CoA thioesterase PaaI [Thalassobaculum sp. OXR-137]WPZ32763.1 hydroxyphenylacetyl-CoA thioesterase PaaI [Thalassobaculum sp. OXR-137]
MDITDDTPPQELAEACAAALWADDRASREMGIALDRVGPGEAVMSMTVREEMTNGHGTAHGGFIFALADSAFAYACNGSNQRSVAQHCSITYLAPAAAGDRLTATAVERAVAGRSGIYDVTVADQTGRVVAEFRGHSRTIKGTLLGA